MLIDENKEKKVPIGLDVYNYGPISSDSQGIIDNYCVKKQFLFTSTVLV